ncbi:MAG: hypothetical protein JXR31_13130, partial [Prolixibacteraceae bacterium]|nr:hypothetical protein [Prolixibacteraceae bacterium]
MKKTAIGIIFFLIISLTVLSQTPQSFNYQAVLRDASGQVLANQQVEISISILQGSASGFEVFSETHSTATNNFGLANLIIGSVNPAGMETVDWSAGPYFVQVSVGGVVMGTSPLLSVPYALHALTVEIDAVDDADADPTNELQDISLEGHELSITEGSTVTLPDEVDDDDADPTNEIQILSISGDTIFLSGGGFAILPAEADPLFSLWDKSSGVAISESQITDLQHFTNADEIDPVFETSLAKQITKSDTSYWGKDADPTNELQVLS